MHRAHRARRACKDRAGDAHLTDIREHEAEARAQPSILHADLDAFYASVEQLLDPSLAGRPVVVGGLGPRGVVAAASYEARRFGVRSAMPMARARRACPDGVFLAPRFDEYAARSRTFMEILERFTPLVEPLALDEAFLDVAGAGRAHGSGPEIAAEIRRVVQAELSLAVSVGAATTKLVAKLASDMAKPDGLLVVEPGRELALLHPLPVERLWGVGPATRKRLASLGVRTVAELAATPEDALARAIGPTHAHHLHALAWNRDERRVEPGRERKSIGHEETFAEDKTDRVDLERVTIRIAELVAQRLREKALVAKTVQLKVRYGDFRTITRARTLAEPTDLGGELAAAARDLLDAVDIGDGLRLLGVSCSQLAPASASQPTLFGGEEHRDRRASLETNVDALRARFGPEAVTRGQDRARS